MRAGGTDPELERKLKAAQDELKAKTKTADALEKSKKELTKKVEDEVLARAKAEADCAMYSKMVEIMQDKSGSADKSKQKSTTLCRDIGKPGGCPMAGACQFLHLARAKENKETDCHHWMKGKCRYSDKDCRFKHNPAKKSVDESKRKRSEEVEPTKDSGQDFLLGLVKTLAQSVAREPQLGSGTCSAWGMEGQRNIRQRMESHSPAGGMEGQQRRTFASTVDPNSRMERQASPSRGMENHGLLEQVVDRMRGLTRQPPTSAPVDKLQEGIQLLVQIAQQAGRQ